MTAGESSKILRHNGEVAYYHAVPRDDAAFALANLVPVTDAPDTRGGRGLLTRFVDEEAQADPSTGLLYPFCGPLHPTLTLTLPPTLRANLLRSLAVSVIVGLAVVAAVYSTSHYHSRRGGHLVGSHISTTASSSSSGEDLARTAEVTHDDHFQRRQ